MGYLKGTSIVFYYLAAASKGDVFKAPATWRAARTQSHFIHITGSYCVWWIAVCLNRCVTCASGEKVNSRVPCGNLNIRRCTWKHALFSATVSQNVLWSTRKLQERFDSSVSNAPGDRFSNVLYKNAPVWVQHFHHRAPSAWASTCNLMRIDWIVPYVLHLYY
jgi:hypothetical protein